MTYKEVLVKKSAFQDYILKVLPQDTRYKLIGRKLGQKLNKNTVMDLVKQVNNKPVYKFPSMDYIAKIHDNWSKEK